MSNHWEFYYTGIDDQPVGILVDMGISGDAPRAALNHLIKLFLRLPRTDEFGFPVSEDIPELDRVEDAIDESMVRLDLELDYVGRLTRQGVRAFYYYTGEPAEVEAALRATLATFAGFQFDIQTQADPEWSEYFEMLYPNDREQQIIGNGHVLQNLQKAGDNPEIARDVLHWAYFPKAECREAFEREVNGRGFQTVEKQDQSVGDNPFSLGFSKVIPLDPNTINQAVIELFDLADEHQGEYTGWETSVQRG